MSSICRKVVVGGFSTGAGLALNLAARVDQVAGVFAVAAPMTLKDFSSKFAPAVDMWNRIMDKAYHVGPQKIFVENKPENPHINYLRNPISGVKELARLMDDLEPKLADLNKPALIIQSRRDPVVDPKGSRKIFELIHKYPVIFFPLRNYKIMILSFNTEYYFILIISLFLMV